MASSLYGNRAFPNPGLIMKREKTTKPAMKWYAPCCEDPTDDFTTAISISADDSPTSMDQTSSSDENQFIPLPPYLQLHPLNLTSSSEEGPPGLAILMLDGEQDDDDLDELTTSSHTTSSVACLAQIFAPSVYKTPPPPFVPNFAPCFEISGTHHTKFRLNWNEDTPQRYDTLYQTKQVNKYKTKKQKKKRTARNESEKPGKNGVMDGSLVRRHSAASEQTSGKLRSSTSNKNDEKNTCIGGTNAAEQWYPMLEGTGSLFFTKLAFAPPTFIQTIRANHANQQRFMVRLRLRGERATETLHPKALLKALSQSPRTRRSNREHHLKDSMASISMTTTSYSLPVDDDEEEEDGFNVGEI